MIRPVLAGLAALSAFAVACAAEIVDQSQPQIDAGRGYLGIGGGNEQNLAQTFRAGVTGDLVALRLPVVGCAHGDLVIELRLAGRDGGPGGPVLNTTRIAPALAPAGGAALHEFRLSGPVRIRASADYAFTLKMEPPTAYCNYAHSPLDGDLYADGSFYFDTLPNPPGWVASESTGGQSDLAFETVVETGRGPAASGDRNCLVPGAPGAPLPIPENLPVCKCLRDGGLREFRCAFLHPDFLAVRRTPWPVDPGRPYAETWEVLPLTKPRGPIAVRLEGGDLPQPVELAFKGLSRKSVQARAVTLMAPDAAVDPHGAAILTYGAEKWTLVRRVPAHDADPGPAAGLPRSKQR